MKKTVIFEACYMWTDLIEILGEERAKRLRKRGSFGKAYKSDSKEVYFEENQFSRWAKKLINRHSNEEV